MTARPKAAIFNHGESRGSREDALRAIYDLWPDVEGGFRGVGGGGSGGGGRLRLGRERGLNWRLEVIFVVGSYNGC